VGVSPPNTKNLGAVRRARWVCRPLTPKIGCSEKSKVGVSLVAEVPEVPETCDLNNLTKTHQSIIEGAMVRSNSAHQI